jgi:PKD repeat protein
MLPLVHFAQTNKISSLQNLPPDVHFSWENACAGDTVCFTNQTQLANTFTWTIIGGPGHPHTIYTSNNTDICYFFSTPGNYTVSLHAYNNHDVIVSKTITIDTITKADFNFIRCANVFSNNSLCASTFYWDFGDGNTSTVFSPTHQYADTGYYNVKLIAYNGSKSDTILTRIYIDVISYVSPAFSYTISSDTVFVHANYGGISTVYYWNFNDPLHPGTTSATGRDTLHIFTDSTAKYNISLTAINACGPAFSNDSIQIISAIHLPQTPSHLQFISNLAIIPDPVENDELNVFYDSFTTGDFLVTIYDPIGRLMTEEYFTFLPGTNGFKIATPGYSKGVYVLTLIYQNTYTRRKFVIN